jgi:ferrous iron transport protein B
MSALPSHSLSTLSVAIAGNPNAGKTSLFNALTGLRQKIANYPGVTVEATRGVWYLDDHSPVAVIDLPGLYSLNATSIDEQIACDTLVGSGERYEPSISPDVIIVAIDATNLSRNLYLATQVIELGRPTVVALTMFDLALRNGIEINVPSLANALGVPVVPVVARRLIGIDALADAVKKIAEQTRVSVSATRIDDALTIRKHELLDRYQRIDTLLSHVLTQKSSEGLSRTERIDAVLTHRIFGPLILIAVVLFVFQMIFSWANLPMNLIDGGFSDLSLFVRTSLPPGVFTDLLADGVIAGVGGVLVFLPQILLLFLFIAILEESGYMARAAFLMDRLMRSVGLDGKAFLPLAMSFACAVPAVMATRTIQSTKDRITTIMIAPFMSCSARLPVYTLMIASCFANQKTFGFISSGALIILTMYLLGISTAVGVAWLLKHSILRAPSTLFVMELPVYRIPSVSNVFHTMLTRAGLFVKRASTVILAASILLWALVAFPRSTGPSSITASEQVKNSYAGRAGRLMEPFIAPLGFDWRIGIGLISSFAARETIVSTLGVVYNVSEEDESQRSGSLVKAMMEAKRSDGSPMWTPLVGLSLMVFFVLACQCMSTLAVVRRETNSWRWPLFMVSYMLVLAYAGSFVTFQGGKLLGFN